MDPFAADPFGTQAAREIEVDIFTAAYRVTGLLLTRFGRVADILNQATTTHLAVGNATVSEHGRPSSSAQVPQALVAVGEILLMVARGASGAASPDMRVAKRPVRARLGIPPYRLEGTVHIPHDSNPVDGLLNVADRFLPMTDVSIRVAADGDGSGEQVDALAFRRDRAHVIVFADDDRPESLGAVAPDAAEGA